MKRSIYYWWMNGLFIGLALSLFLIQPLHASGIHLTYSDIHILYPDLSGTWYVNGDPNQIATITQNGGNLSFTTGQYSTNGYFVNDQKVYAMSWNAYGEISGDAQKITWDNQVWYRQPQQGVQPTYDLGGTWYINGDPSQTVIITQNGNNLQFSMAGNYSDGNFYGTNQIFATAWNAYGNISQDGNTLTWGNQTWNRQAIQTGKTQIYCRGELSDLYYMSQTLGTAWGSAGAIPSFSGTGQQNIYSALEYVQQILASLECIQYPPERIELMIEGWAGVAKVQVVRDIEKLITDLQNIINNVDWSCDNNVNPVQLYIAGVHLGAAQAWASLEMCSERPVRGQIQQTINAHLGTALTAARSYAACIPDFDFASFQRVRVNANNAIEPHTQIVGVETLLFWSVGMSDCCCRCTGAVTSLNPVDNDQKCHDDCERYCKSQGFNSGRWDKVSPCLLGEVTNKAGGCNCR